MREMGVTMTFKQKKGDLVREGFDPNTVKDPMYFNDANENAFVRLDEALYERIQARQVRA